jgi:hypothetical protein
MKKAKEEDNEIPFWRDEIVSMFDRFVKPGQEIILNILREFIQRLTSKDV